MTVTAAMVKELRERTAVGMMDCKKALVEANGDMELAIDNMRKSGQAKAAKKAGRIAAEGVILTKAENGVATIVELNCETDFVARDESFVAFGAKLIKVAFAAKANSIEVLNAEKIGELSVEETRANLVNKIGENMTVRRVTTIEGAELTASYVHGGRIGVIAAMNGGDAELAKDIAMHAAAANPQYVKPEDVPADVVAKEKEIQLDIALQSGKPKEIAEKMVNGRMAKFTGEVSLTGQPFVKDPSMKVSQLLKDKSADVTTFIRFEVGEGIEKKSEDFAAEVEAQIAAAKK
ncbi:MAG: elongation factor Ts [Alteromonadaceae bacterium]|nr:elongation factor Ts [Alteromonadaceae bacterium]